jgi:8-oxo-dGTP diphosphatase
VNVKPARGMSHRQKSKKASAASYFRVTVWAVIEQGGLYLLARRRDNGWWNLVGGGLERGETIEVGLAREVLEEIGVSVQIERLVGVYTKPGKHEVALVFNCHLSASVESPHATEETAEVAWFLPNNLPSDLMPRHRERIQDAVLGHAKAVVKDQASWTEDDQRLRDQSRAMLPESFRRRGSR